jgi:hypothetical protein
VGTEREQKGRGRGLQRAKRSQKEGGSTGDFRNSLAVVISSLSFTQVSIALTPPAAQVSYMSFASPPPFLQIFCSLRSHPLLKKYFHFKKCNEK